MEIVYKNLVGRSLYTNILAVLFIVCLYLYVYVYVCVCIQEYILACLLPGV